MTSNPLISIIVLNYNGASYLSNCINSVLNSQYENFEIILVDNNSSDKSGINCKNKFPSIELLENSTNLGLYARNLGVDKSNGEYIVFLDSDTEVEPNWLNNLLESFQKHGPGLYQGKLLQMNNQNIVDSCGDMINVFGFGFARERGNIDVGKHSKFDSIGFTVGACTFTSKKIIKKIGKIDESKLLFQMLDDLDYGWRGWLLNIPSYYEPKAIVYHIGSPTLKFTSKKFFFLERNRWICLLSLYSRKSLFKLLPYLFIVELGIFFFLLPKGFGPAKIKSFFSIIFMIPKINKRYRQIQKTRILDDCAIVSHFVSAVHLTNFFSNIDSSNFSYRILEKLGIRAKLMLS